VYRDPVGQHGCGRGEGRLRLPERLRPVPRRRGRARHGNEAVASRSRPASHPRLHPTTREQETSMRRALVLSGGGAKGVWQVGACEHLIAERGYWFDVISGVSAVAVNAAALAPAADALGPERELERLRAVRLGPRGHCRLYRPP